MQGFTQIDDINEEILKHINITEIIDIISTNKNNKKLLHNVLPEIIERSFHHKDMIQKSNAVKDLKDITIELLERDEIDLAKIIIDEIGGSFLGRRFYEGVFFKIYETRNEKLLENVLRAEPANKDWVYANVYDEIDDAIDDIKGNRKELKKYMLFLIRPALKTRSVPILTKIIERYDFFKRFINDQNSGEEESYYRVVIPELNKLIQKAKLIVSINNLIDAWEEIMDNPDYDYEGDIDIMDDIVDRLENVSF